MRCRWCSDGQCRRRITWAVPTTGRFVRFGTPPQVSELAEAWTQGAWTAERWTMEAGMEKVSTEGGGHQGRTRQYPEHAEDL